MQSVSPDQIDARPERLSTGGDPPAPLARAEIESGEAIAAARYAVSEYLRDLGLRDPDLIAQETRRIVDQALAEFAAGEPVYEPLLCETAIRLTVKQLEVLLRKLSIQRGTAEQAEKPEALVAADLPHLFGQFPDVLREQGGSDEVAGKLQRVVPQANPKPMKPQALQLVPRAYRRLVDFFTNLRSN